MFKMLINMLEISKMQLRVDSFMYFNRYCANIDFYSHRMSEGWIEDLSI